MPEPRSIEVNALGTGLVMRRVKWDHPVHNKNVGLTVLYDFGAGPRDARVSDAGIEWLIEFAERPKPGTTGAITYRYLFELSEADRAARDESARAASDSASTFVDANRDPAALSAEFPKLFAPLRAYESASGAKGDAVALGVLGFEPDGNVWKPPRDPSSNSAPGPACDCSSARPGAMRTDWPRCPSHRRVIH